MLTRKHFREAAKLIGDLDPERPLTREDVAKIFAEFFRSENPRFQSEKFLEAIETTTPKTTKPAKNEWEHLLPGDP